MGAPEGAEEIVRHGIFGYFVKHNKRMFYYPSLPTTSTD